MTPAGFGRAALVLCGAMACGRSSLHSSRDPATAPGASPSSATTLSAAPGPTTSGMFEYLARIKGNEIRGHFAVSGRIVIFDLPDGTCRPTSAPDWTASTTSARYECRSALAPELVHFTIDVRNPMGRSQWQMTVREQRQRNVCVEYAQRGGRNVCVRTQSQPYEVVTPYSGPLVVRRVERERTHRTEGRGSWHAGRGVAGSREAGVGSVWRRQASSDML